MGFTSGHAVMLSPFIHTRCMWLQGMGSRAVCFGLVRCAWPPRQVPDCGCDRTGPYQAGESFRRSRLHKRDNSWNNSRS